ncbi:hypothetical protein SS50377_28707 [Spironucleus salmonicida]|uniref:Uncharacterized protein n=1 Tax=Spironucleus salmonicida TaxID=348837 RepID=A0A9P8LKE4_9EUKA|nr:hypothetical protein SS50377_28707 [Spironucleus salmonicida]
MLKNEIQERAFSYLQVLKRPVTRTSSLIINLPEIRLQPKRVQSPLRCFKAARSVDELSVFQIIF